ncbi:MAG: DUF2948 family protein [Rhodospirillales bacterium]|nr:DUF2948 family protein [Rhodospirillales bacterium]
MSGVLKLRAEDEEDFQVISAFLQDALIPMRDMQYVADGQRFALVVSRFRWENCAEGPDSPVADMIVPEPETDENLDAALIKCQSYERVNCGICFDGVRQVRCRGLDQRDRERILELLAIESEPGAVVLVFAGGGILRLEGQDINCRLEDLGLPWPTRWRPRHPTGDAA